MNSATWIVVFSVQLTVQTEPKTENTVKYSLTVFVQSAVQRNRYEQKVISSVKIALASGHVRQHQCVANCPSQRVLARSCVIIHDLAKTAVLGMITHNNA